MEYRVTAPLTVGPGVVLRLTKEQAAARRGLIRDLGRGRYSVERAVEFKAGEVIDTAAPLPKSAVALVAVVAEKARTEVVTKD